jgi:predicted dehydrogenase
VTRIGLIGAGFMGTTHARAWSATDATLTAVLAGPDSPPEELADEHGATAFTQLDAFLDVVDVVDVCAPTHLHAEFTLAAARASKHVICEKPLARTPEDGAEMVAACRDAGVQLLVGHVVRFFPEYLAAKAAVERGAVGEPAVLRFSRATFQPRRPAGNWFIDQQKSGGLVLDLMVHDLDYARWVGGEVTSVYARSVQGARPAAGIDHAVAILRHAGGALSNVEASWAYPHGHFRTRGEIAGDAGVVSWDSARTDPMRTFLHEQQRGGDTPLAASTLDEDPYTTQLRHFLAVLRGDAEPVVTGEDGLASLRLAAAVARSIETGEVASLDPVEVPA